jgi:hypothetical protein
LINNRQQNGRRRGRNGPQVRNGPGNGPERGNRIDSRARGNAAQLHEKYKNLARDTHQQGDRVMTEYYLQFADHYFRVLAESRPRFEEGQGQAQGQNQQNRRPQNQHDEFDGNGYDDDGMDDGGEQDVAADPRRYEQPRDREPRRDVQRDQPRDREQSRDRDQPRDREQPRDRDQPREAQRDPQPQQDRDTQPPRDREPRRETRRDGRRDNYRDEQQAQPVQAEAEAPRAPAPAPVTIPATEVSAEPRRRGRPRKVRPEDAVEAVEEDRAPRIEIDRLPPSFSSAEPANEAADGEEPAPRRRRARRAGAEDSNVAA